MPPPTAPRTRSKDGKTEIRTSTKPDAKRETAARSTEMIVEVTETEAVKKRKRDNESDGKNCTALRRRREISEHLRDYLHDSSHMIGKLVAKEVHNRIAAMEDKRLVEAGRVFIGWSSYKVRDYEVVQRCYECYGYGHRLTECKLKGRVCRKCGRIGHTQLECDNDDVWCGNCKVKNNEANHEVTSIECPEYKNALARMRNATYYE
ncbi:hypothetical protein CBL_20840 [Carabus blaptoides fortunei]